METKSSIRKQILSMRNSLSEAERQKKSLLIQERLFCLPELYNAEIILCYADYNSEVKTSAIMDDLLHMNKQVYLPRVSGSSMDFYRIKDHTDLHPGYRNIPEPLENKDFLFTKEFLDQKKERVVMLLPGAAFDTKGVRVGYGKGFYDRYLQKIPVKTRIALSYELQILPDICADLHDIPVCTIVTEEKVRRIERN